MSFNLANKPLAERAALEDEKSRLYDLWQSNLGKAKGDAARLFGERAKRKGKWAEWVRSELDAMSPPEYANMVRSEVNRLICDASRAKADIGWTPQVTLDQGLQQTMDWVGRNLAAYRPGQYTV